MPIPLYITFVLICSLVLQNSSSMIKNQFPSIPANALSGEPKTVPVPGELQFLVVAFEQRAQPQADQWFKVYQENFSRQGAVFYELPMISSFWKWMSGWIDKGMRSGIPKEKHGNVLTYYGPLDAYFKAMGVKDKSLVYVFLVNRQGEILQREAGAPTREKIDRIASKL